MQIAPIDIALLLVAIVAGTYCFLLNRRLKALHDTRDGMGVTIQALSETISKMHAVTDASGQQARAMAEALELQMRQTKGLSQHMERLVAEGRILSSKIEDQMMDIESYSTTSRLLFDAPEATHATRDESVGKKVRFGYDDE